MCLWCVQKRKDLTATESHVVLLEYFEESPLLLWPSDILYCIHTTEPYVYGVCRSEKT